MKKVFLLIVLLLGSVYLADTEGAENSGLSKAKGSGKNTGNKNGLLKEKNINNSKVAKSSAPTTKSKTKTEDGKSNEGKKDVKSENKGNEKNSSQVNETKVKPSTKVENTTGKKEENSNSSSQGKKEETTPIEKEDDKTPKKNDASSKAETSKPEKKEQHLLRKPNTKSKTPPTHSSSESSSSSSSPSPQQSNTINSTVIILTDKTFNSTVNEGKDSKWVILYYAPWCPHCQQFKPTFRKYAKNETEAKVGQINCEKYKNLCRRFRITGYPTILLFENSKMYKSQGTQSLKSLHEFSHSKYKSLPALKIYTDMPSASEYFYLHVTGFFETLRAAYKTNKFFAILLIFLIISCVVLILWLIIGLIYDFCCADEIEKMDKKRTYESIHGEGRSIEVI